ncbi:MAG: hypothetical protein AAF394_11745, partial [Planctomycetota bacterium]
SILPSLVLSVGVSLMIALQPAELTADDGFRVDTKISREGSSELLSKTTSLFFGGIAYDFQDADITIIDPASDKITCVHLGTKLRMEIKISALEDLIPRAEEQAKFGKAAAFLASAKQIRREEHLVAVGEGGPLAYVATFQRPDDTTQAAAFAKAYQQFADASMLLNSFSRGANGAPPFARLALNRELAAKNVLPKEITLTQGGGDPAVYNCDVRAVWSLSANDQSKLLELQRMKDTFQLVEPATYHARAEAARVAAQRAEAARVAAQPAAANR